MQEATLGSTLPLYFRNLQYVQDYAMSNNNLCTCTRVIRQGAKGMLKTRDKHGLDNNQP